jgi:UvrD/REP helicase N-terminal domain
LVEAAVIGSRDRWRQRLAGLGAGITTLDHIVAVTFTEKAAGETKLQLRGEIEAARAAVRPEQRARLDRAIEALELARIGTIHAFCADLLHERPVEAGIDPLFAVAADAEAQALVDEAFDSWFETVLGDPPEGVRRLLRRRSERVMPREQLRTAMMSLLDHRVFPHRGAATRSTATGESMRSSATLLSSGRSAPAPRRPPTRSPAIWRTSAGS